VRTKSQLGWLNLPHLPILPPPMTAKERVVIIPYQSEEETNGYRRKDFEKRKFLRREWKMARESQQVVHDQSMTMEKSWVMMTAQTDKEHGE